MGSKVSGKMAAAGRVVQAVRPHAPLIKFPNRKGTPRPSAEEALKMIVASPAPATSPVSAPSPPVLPPSRPPGLVSRLPGIPDTVATARDFPPRYRRRVLADEEMEYIQRGGPE
ncbi:28S ribosomal protein S36, mitochondrial [Clupea harengus]|uniref:28S ribosomal protein S36, mitochondrial n=1 Tax=Clupea harengus TaxID=7950 RepID=A0A6P8FSD1_CLUHA|nr:28S ribosomal protein S36, mitochondrial [Clupea harengus]XP_012684052.1 28S ribosomal protein S36, mitochondrial [Clupea harengus]XP_031426456.1 28S ribosomal protein S36, mitochondrial [Clupea harengus]